MIEYQQILTLIIILSLYLFLLWLLRHFKLEVSKYWIICISLIVLGELFSVLERVSIPLLFNTLEHLSFTMACLSFFVAVSTIKGSHE